MKKYLLLIWLVTLTTLSCWQDSFLKNYFGEIARCPIVFFLPIFLIIEIKNLGNPVYNTIRKINQIFIRYFLWSLFATIIFISFFYSQNGTFVFLKEVIPLKFLKIFVYYFIVVLYLRHLFLLLKTIKNKNLILNGMFISLLIQFIVLLVEFKNLPTGWSFLHIIPESDRIRLLTGEASTASPIVIMLTSISLLHKKISVKIISIMFGLTYIVLTTSKSFILLTAISLIILVFKNVDMRNIKTWYKGFVIITVLIFFSYFTLPSFVSLIVKDLEEFTSTVTRVSTNTNSLYLILKNPLGYGGGYFVAFFKEIPTTLETVNGYLLGNTIELDFMQIKGTADFSVGSSMLEWGLIGGWLGLYLYFNFWTYFIKNTKGTLLSLSVLYMFLFSTFIQSDLIKYEIYFTLAFSLFWYHEHNKSNRIFQKIDK